ncbi:pantothenate kinase [Pannus brasiliensis CCIBt3594]|uniref:Type III pantothenate kinase n=1 Tax=Pannus brasiliensis CCIBt3594 TaxID=1427578 RepID=A0AAW9QJ39_9CHRO
MTTRAGVPENTLMTFLDDWLALAIGNSRLHWGRFRGDRLESVLDTPHLTVPLSLDNLPEIVPDLLTKNASRVLPLRIASVVPRQTELCAGYPGARVITLAEIPLEDLYPTLGIDRALAVLGAGERYGFPCLVIDAGTALTFTGVDAGRRLMGGAILPGLGLQFRSLGERTANLPYLELPGELPPLWARNTREAIESGIIHTLRAGMERFIEDWWKRYPDSSIVLSGGDADRLERYWRAGEGRAIGKLRLDRTLIFQGILSVSVPFFKRDPIPPIQI